MKTSSQNVALYQLSYSQVKTYIFAALFIVGNIALPQLCHLMPQGGLIFLPIYFFTLIAAYKYGFAVGLTTAVLSPLVNSAIFGMPPAEIPLLSLAWTFPLSLPYFTLPVAPLPDTLGPAHISDWLVSYHSCLELLRFLTHISCLLNFCSVCRLCLEHSPHTQLPH